jgi:hypothetical protein
VNIYRAGDQLPTISDADRNGNILIRAANGMCAERPWNTDMDPDQEWMHTFYWEGNR